MFHSIIFQYSYEALLLTLIISGPPILFASLMGLFVAIFQSATQIQEQTLSFAIKMVVVLATIILMGGWLGGFIHQFATQIFSNFHRWTK
ncbi:MAG: type III secretion system export apparatus subunit SctS [Chlamydiia bacterium]|nr:type III secretion system export apparatus subunit SctS [Chlamydiia bacterium]